MRKERSEKTNRFRPGPAATIGGLVVYVCRRLVWSGANCGTPQQGIPRWVEAYCFRLTRRDSSDTMARHGITGNPGDTMKRLNEIPHNRSCAEQLSPRWKQMTGVSELGWRRREASLWLLCLAVFTVTLTDSQKCSLETIKEVQGVLRQIERKPFDCNLYTPDLEDYENCPNSTLTCFAKEVEVLLYEGTFSKIPKLKKRLLLLITKKDKDGCSQCEFYPEKAAEEFLISLKSLLQEDCALSPS